jgi:hypothetical protein
VFSSSHKGLTCHQGLHSRVREPSMRSMASPSAKTAAAGGKRVGHQRIAAHDMCRRVRSEEDAYQNDEDGYGNADKSML